MKDVMRKLAVSGLLALAAGAASAEVSVNFIEPGRFTDLPFTEWDRKEVLKELTEHFTKLGARLPPGQNLRIDVKDVDLAGRMYPSRRGQDLRVIRDGAEWPRIDLHYAIESNGQVVRSGDAQLRDMAFMQHIGRYSDGDSLRYEKQMIDEWFYSTIAPRERAARR
jgi:Protein of unknown function (DUF3016)